VEKEYRRREGDEDMKGIKKEIYRIISC